MKIVLGSLLLVMTLMVASCGEDEEQGTLYCCALDHLCSKRGIGINPCQTDMTMLDAVRDGDESKCRSIINNNNLTIHMSDCSQNPDTCYYEEADALAECQ